MQSKSYIEALRLQLYYIRIKTAEGNITRQSRIKLRRNITREANITINKQKSSPFSDVLNGELVGGM